MADVKSRLGLAFHFVHQNFVWLLLGAYVLAAVAPGPALAIRGIELGDVTFLGERTRISMPMLMLAFLLLNAGLGVRTSELRNLLRQPRFLIGGLAANIFVPVAFIFAVVQIMRLWHNPDEVQHILLGLALVAAMPIAGSSTAWTQNANGDLSLGLALVLFSTILSPLTTPMTFDLVEPMATGEYRVAVDRLEAGDTGVLLIGCVLAPSLLGIGLRYAAGEERIGTLRPGFKLINAIDL